MTGDTTGAHTVGFVGLGMATCSRPDTAWSSTTGDGGLHHGVLVRAVERLSRLTPDPTAAT